MLRDSVPCGPCLRRKWFEEREVEQERGGEGEGGRGGGRMDGVKGDVYGRGRSG